jgi:hypothetical protein
MLDASSRRPFMRRILTHAALLIGFVAQSAGCTWVKMDPAAAHVRVLPLGRQMASCRRLGEIAVSVKDHVGPYERNTMKVRDELETLARNEALTLHANTVQPEAEPADGQQRWIAYRCNDVTGRARSSVNEQVVAIP